MDLPLIYSQTDNFDAKNPVVSVLIVTHKHEDYIEECINSVLAQKTNFPIEVLIGVDQSHDRTEELCLDLEKQYPDILKVVINNPNNSLVVRGIKVPQRNGANIYNKAKGKYIALLDGDDYWCDPLKLQKQVDLLDKHNECIGCHHWHKYTRQDEKGFFHEEIAPTINQGYHSERFATVKEIFSNKMRVKARTLMFRNTFEPLPEYFFQVPFGDVALSIILGGKGKFIFIDESMAVYRQTNKGVSTSGKQNDDFLMKHFFNWVDLWEKGDLYSHGEYRAEAMETIIFFYKKIMHFYNDSYQIFLNCIKNCLIHSNYPFRLRAIIAFKLSYHHFFKY